ncbi:unnamed protein product, partial [Prorocentrum cordatum]
PLWLNRSRLPHQTLTQSDRASQMAAFKFAALLLVACPATAHAASLRSNTRAAANPVRRVVSMLQSMQKKVEAEGDKEEEMYKRFSCYCKTGATDLSASISAAGTKSTQLGSDVKAAEEQLAQVKQGLGDAQTERAEAKTAVAKATSIRGKEAAGFAATKAELESYISAIKQAVAALTKGMAGGFLQTTSASLLRKIVLTKGDAIQDEDREALLSFLSGKDSSSYVPQSGEVTGILKEMGDSFSKSLSDASDTEANAIKEFEALVAAKAKEIDALTMSIEAKTSKSGSLGVTIVQMRNDMSDSEIALLEDQKLLQELESGCSTKDKEYEERVKTRHDELAALTETIKILNDDDALDLGENTPSAQCELDAGRDHDHQPTRARRGLDPACAGEERGGPRPPRLPGAGSPGQEGRVRDCDQNDRRHGRAAEERAGR